MQWEHVAAANTRTARAESSSEVALFSGYKALTPVYLITGSICGGVLVIACIVALVWHLFKRRKGRDAPKQINQTERYIIPPDPANLQGYRIPEKHLSTQR
ncbi:hypothetical protein AZE42_06448 [Rhizopogon vesiculosus]|uniref:Uncharacterized protein n=1 Tax=Rhizopogon vesiculosus TaxID=180088 RepID=A0A1J8QH00_9AGAM|nr:hypothetical protein AZE42_06448 [Rhizopogon vesiculosus]